MLKDTTILYQGGSGGFALFYYLLLSGEFYTGISYQSVAKLIEHQFPESLKTIPHKWKQKEFWPNNVACKMSNNSPRLFLICNPCWDNHVLAENLAVSNNTRKILLYTDFRLQLRMCYEKQAYWFTNISRERFCAPARPREYLRQIIQSKVNNRDPMIPHVIRIFQPTQFVLLEEFIRRKELDYFPKPNQAQLDFLDRWIRLQPKKALRYL